MNNKVYLTDIEVESVIKFIENETMREAVKKVILEVIYDGTLESDKPANPLKNFALGLVSQKGGFSNEEVGADLRAIWEGINMLESGFESLSKYKKEVEEGKKEGNKAR